MPKPVVVTRTVPLDSSPEQLWLAVTDTERLNRAIGFASIELTPNEDDSAARYVVRTVSGPGSAGASGSRFEATCPGSSV